MKRTNEIRVWPQKLWQLNKNIRAVLDYLKMIGNSQAKTHT